MIDALLIIFGVIIVGVLYFILWGIFKTAEAIDEKLGVLMKFQPGAIGRAREKQQRARRKSELSKHDIGM